MLNYSFLLHQFAINKVTGEHHFLKCTSILLVLSLLTMLSVSWADEHSDAPQKPSPPRPTSLSPT